MTNEGENKIEELKEVLYSPNTKLPDTMILDLKKHTTNLKEEWEEEKVGDTSSKVDSKKISIIILMSAAVFFVVSVLFASFTYFKGDNIISPNNINIEIFGPVTTNAGEPLALDLIITNNNDTPLILSDLLVEYPKGTKNSTDKTSDLIRERIPVGTIAPNQTVRKSINALVFGEEGTTSEIKYKLEYRLENSSGVFNYDGTHDVVIGSAPLALKVDMLKEINADQDLIIDILVSSNSNEVIKNILLEGVFPAGFQIKSIVPASVINKTVWELGDIESEGERKIRIIGALTGVQDEEKTFKFVVGGKSTNNDVVIEKPFLNLAKSVMLKKPFISIGLSVDQDNRTIKSGKAIENVISFQNNLAVPVTDVVIEAKLKGDMVVKESVDAQGGFYRASTDTLVWTKIESPKLASVASGESSDVFFDYILLSAFAKNASGLKNQEVLVDITVRGKRLSEDNVPETIQSTITRKVQIESDARLNTIVNHFEGQFKNTGPYPPKVENKTEFAVTWAVTNSLNTLEDAVLEATIPAYVEWIGETAPTAERIIFDKDAQKIRWEIGKILPGGGIAGSLRKVTFKLGFTPSLSQVGQTPELVNLATFTARDTFAGTDLKLTNIPATISIPTEEKFEFGQDKVIK